MNIKLNDLQEFDAAEYLDSPEALSTYLTDVLSARDAALLAQALGTVARARGMTEVAQKAGVAREALYKALREGAQPRFETIERVLSALGLQLVVVPAESDVPAKHNDERFALGA